MMFVKSAGLLVLGLVAGTMATTIQVAVGMNGLAFSPPSVTAAIGDIVSFNL